MFIDFLIVLDIFSENFQVLKYVIYVRVFVFMALLQSFHQSGLEEGKNFVDWREREGRNSFPPILASSSSYFPPSAAPSPPSSSLFFLFLSPTLTSNSLPRRTGIVASIVAAKEATCDQRISRLILSAGR